MATSTTSTTNKEKSLQDKCIDYLKEKECYHLNIYGSARTGKGAPDLIACINGQFVAFELKVGKNTMQDDQIIHKIRIERANGRHYVPKTIEEFKAIVDKLL